MSDTFTLRDYGNVTGIIDACEHGYRVARIDADTGHVTYGVARAITGPEGQRMDENKDLRNHYLRVSTINGLSLDVFWPVNDLMAEVQAGTFIPHVMSLGRPVCDHCES